jgi:Na+-transporting NADH:ubiquinone oxidoreductase subunit C
VAKTPDIEVMSKESIFRTVLVAFVVALFCSLMVSAAVYYLRPVQLVYKNLAQNRAIVEVAGLIPTGEPLSDGEVIRHLLALDARMVDMSTGHFVDDLDAWSFDQRAAAADPERGVEIPESRDIAQLKRRSQYAPVYLVLDGNAIQRIVLPVHGQGMWSRIYGYISLTADLNTIAAVRFYEHGETPGIGDRIQDDAWTSRWSGKRLFDQSGNVAFQVSKDDQPSPYHVDSISGASVTAQSVGQLIRYWVGGDGFGPLIIRLTQARGIVNPRD